MAVNVKGGSIGYRGHYRGGYNVGYDGGHEEGGYGGDQLDGGHLSGNEIGTGHEKVNYHVSQFIRSQEKIVRVTIIIIIIRLATLKGENCHI